MSAPVNPGKPALPENVLYRSRIEICRILRALVKGQSSIFSEIGGGWTFVSHILFVDSRKGYFVISYCANKLLNSKLLELRSLRFTASNQDAHFMFGVSNPVETRFKGQPAIQFTLPNSLILYHRREYPRLPVPVEASLRCVADAGGIAPFESHITDITHDGFGCILYNRDIKLEPGAVLKGCRIIIPSGKAVVADLELRYIMTIPLPDGTLANRAGLRFIQRPDEIAELVNFFIQNLDNNPDILKL